ncbi:MAG TPA: serine/threonine-protein kinase, partial [Gemmatimonadales bacterium]|nr:serine/threonine-protein kinase [Gemmatimonadales bacterium]
MTDATARVAAALAGRYRIERELGQGGMATVYLAQDLKHDRRVALKVFRPELAAVLGAERFVQEIRTTAALSHPHILPLFDSGEAGGFLFYVMPVVEGEDLRARLRREHQLSVEDAVEIARVVAGALDYAHRHGVIHRDIKPENILFQDDVPLVADFGIAVALTRAGGNRLTETGLSLGTPAYMSPEQAVGERDLDARSDVYALGCLTYEMLAGDPPFVASTAAAVIARHLTDPAPPVTTVRRNVPAAAAGAIARALSKVPADRQATAGAFAAALTAPDSATAGASRAAMILVLPFVNRSPDPENEFFSDGLTEEVVADLSRVGALGVISRNSAMALKGTTRDTPTLARELGVTHVVTGSVRRAGTALRITVELVEASSDSPV